MKQNLKNAITHLVYQFALHIRYFNKRRLDEVTFAIVALSTKQNFGPIATSFRVL